MSRRQSDCKQRVGTMVTMAVAKSYDDVRIAHAIAIIKARRRCTPTRECEVHWKKKAKTWKAEVLALRQELLEVEDGSTLEKLPLLAPCECLFLNSRLKEKPRTTDAEELISKLSVQRFLQNVRILSRAKKSNERRRAGGLTATACAQDLKGHLALVVDFVVDLLADPSSVGSTHDHVSDSKSFSTYVHQSVKFIGDAMPHLLVEPRTQELQVAASVKKLASALSMNIMNFHSPEEIEAKGHLDKRVWNQQIILELGSVPYIGQQFLSSISKQITEISETLVCIDPFHEGVGQTYNNMFFLLQTFEKLVADHLCAWADTSSFDEDKLQEAVRYHFQTVHLFQNFGNWSSLIAFYTNRITGVIITQLDKIVSLYHKAEGSKHSALLQLVESATSTVLES